MAKICLRTYFLSFDAAKVVINFHMAKCFGGFNTNLTFKGISRRPETLSLLRRTSYRVVQRKSVRTKIKSLHERYPNDHEGNRIKIWKFKIFANRPRRILRVSHRRAVHSVRFRSSCTPWIAMPCVALPLFSLLLCMCCHIGFST